MKKTIVWIAALVVGAILGLLGLHWLDQTMEFVAVVYTRLFQLLAVPTIVLAVITTSPGLRQDFRAYADLHPSDDLCGGGCGSSALCVGGSWQSAC